MPSNFFTTKKPTNRRPKVCKSKKPPPPGDFTYEIYCLPETIWYPTATACWIDAWHKGFPQASNLPYTVDILGGYAAAWGEIHNHVKAYHLCVPDPWNGVAWIYVTFHFPDGTSQLIKTWFVVHWNP